MLKDLLAGIWRRTPKALRRLTTRLSQTKFTVTAAAIVVDEQNRVLLLKHRFRPGVGWGVPGGFLKPDEQPHDGIRRELGEEVGLRVRDLELLAAHTFEKARQIEIVFRCRAEGEVAPQSIEITRAAWFSVATLPDGLPSDQRQLIKQVLEDGANQLD